MQGLFIFPQELDTDKFRHSWGEWIQHRVELRKKLTPLATKKLLNKLASWGHDRAIAAIEFSITNGWIGVYESQGEPKKVDALDGLREFEGRTNGNPF